jgi:calmodulin
MSFEHSDFTEFEIAEYKEAFRLWDSNNDGELTPKELTNLFKSIGHNFTEGEVVRLMKETGHPDKVDFNGFLQILSKFMEKKKAASEDELIAAFELFDKEGKGYVSAGELRHLMMTLGDKLTEDEGEEFMRDADVGGHGQVKYHEFIKMMLYSK